MVFPLHSRGGKSPIFVWAQSSSLSEQTPFQPTPKASHLIWAGNISEQGNRDVESSIYEECKVTRANFLE
jgi:hypothetical protein